MRMSPYRCQKIIMSHWQPCSSRALSTTKSGGGGGGATAAKAVGSLKVLVTSCAVLADEYPTWPCLRDVISCSKH